MGLNIEIDATNLSCPAPQNMLGQALIEMTRGDEVTIRFTDLNAAGHIQALCRAQGHQVLSSAMYGRQVAFRIRVG